jgi:hypothetical protein
MVPDNAEKVSLLWSAKANELGHGYLGTRGRRWSTIFIYVSGILGYVAGFSGLADLISTRWVSAIALAAGVSTTVLILLLTTLKADAHLRAAGKYQSIYLGTVSCYMDTSEGEARFRTMWDAFEKLVREVDAGDYKLTPGQVKKYKEVAWRELNTIPRKETFQDQARFISG